jgi:hypothetical protein
MPENFNSLINSIESFRELRPWSFCGNEETDRTFTVELAIVVKRSCWTTLFLGEKTRRDRVAFLHTVSQYDIVRNFVA